MLFKYTHSCFTPSSRQSNTHRVGRISNPPHSTAEDEMGIDGGGGGADEGRSSNVIMCGVRSEWVDG